MYSSVVVSRKCHIDGIVISEDNWLEWQIKYPEMLLKKPDVWKEKLFALIIKFLETLHFKYKN